MKKALVKKITRAFFVLLGALKKVHKIIHLIKELF